MRTKTCKHPYLFVFLRRCLLVALLSLTAWPASARSYDDFVLLLDTSGSMRTDNRIGKLKVALINFTNTLPADGKTRVWVFGYDNDLRRITDGLELTDTAKLGDLQLALNSIPEPTGNHTRTWPALNGVFDALVAAQVKNTSTSVSIHVFTDGNADSTKIGFREILQRLTEQRRRNAEYRLYFHLLDCEPAPEVVAAAQPETGVYVVRGLAMPPQIVPDRVRPPGATFLSGAPQRWVGTAVGVAENWLWRFGDGGESTEVSPTHVFARSGEYRVVVEAANKAGKDIRTFNITVASPPPTAAFESAGFYAGAETVLRDVSTGEVASREWKVDGQTVSHDPVWRNTFLIAGNHEVTLTVTGPGGSDTKTGPLRILPRTVAVFSWTPEQPLRGQEVAFINESTNLGPPWHWDFGDGSTSNERNPKHAFAAPKQYTVALTGLSLDGQTLRGERTIEVIVLPPHAGIKLVGVSDNAPTQVGQRLELQSTSTGTIEAWDWDFGDGTKATGQQASHSYATAGSFTIVLTVRGPAGTDTARQPVAVGEPGWKLVARPQPAWLGEPVTFALENPPSHLRSLRWDFGDKTPAQEHTTGNTTEHIYRTEGTFSVSVVATLQNETAIALRRTLTLPVTVQSDSVGLEFEVTGTRVISAPGGRTRVLRGPVPVAVTVVNRSHGPIRSQVWNFGDGTTSDDLAPGHVYRNPGVYEVTLNIVDQRERKFAATANQRFVIEATGWRPLKSWRWPALAALTLTLGLLWRWSPRQLRVVRFECGGQTLSVRSRNKDPVLTSEGTTLRLRLIRTLGLRKRYVLRETNCTWRDARDTQPKRSWIERRDTITKDGKTFILRSLNNSSSTAVNTWLWIFAITATVAWLTWSLFV